MSLVLDRVSRLWLDGRVRDVIADRAGARRLRETGGHLFGYESDEGIVVALALDVGPKTRHHRTRLVPDQGHLQALIEQIFEKSGSRLSYVGDWHSHPLGPARPSGTDVGAAAKMASDEGVDLPRPLVIIQQTHVFHRRVQIGHLAAFRWEPAMETLLPCETVVTTVPAL